MRKVPYLGVSFNKQKNKYRASIKVEGKFHLIGYYETAIEAAKAYDKYLLENNLDKQLNFKVNTLVG